MCMSHRFGMNSPCIALQQSPQPWKLSPLSQLLWPLPHSSCLNNQGKNIYPINSPPIWWSELLSFTRETINLLIGAHELKQREDPSVDQSSWASTEEELVPDWTHHLFSMLQDLMNWEKRNLPRNHGVDWFSPVIVDLMQVCVTNSTEEDLELHISWPGCSASKQSDPMGTEKRKRKKKKQSKMRTQHPTQSPSIIATKTGQFLRICSSPARECEGG